MASAYFQQRLQALLSLMKAALDPCATIVQEEMVRGCRAILAACSLTADYETGLKGRESEFAIQRWTNEGGAGTRGQS